MLLIGKRKFVTEKKFHIYIQDAFHFSLCTQTEKEELPSSKEGNACSEKLSNLSKVTQHHQLLLSTAPAWESLGKGMEGAEWTATASPSQSHTGMPGLLEGVCAWGRG